MSPKEGGRSDGEGKGEVSCEEGQVSIRGRRGIRYGERDLLNIP
jgi:hypothetical protein